MASYVVLTPPDRQDAHERAEIIRDGFAYFALIIPVIWPLWQRLWFAAVLLLLVTIGLGVGFETYPDWSPVFLTAPVLLSLYVGLEGNGLRIAKLERRDWQVDSVIEAPNAATAEAIYFAELRDAPKRTVPPPGRGWAAPLRSVPPSADSGPALGLLDIHGKH